MVYLYYIGMKWYKMVSGSMDGFVVNSVVVTKGILGLGDIITATALGNGIVRVVMNAATGLVKVDSVNGSKMGIYCITGTIGLHDRKR